MKRARAGRMLGGALFLLVWGNPAPVLAQHVICCGLIQDVGGKWFGALRTCDLGGMPPEQRAKLCKTLAGCADAAPYCGGEKQPPSKSGQAPSPSPSPTPAPGGTPQPPPEPR